MLGRYFDAKQQATAAVVSAKKKGGSNIGQAIEIELALKDQVQFERDLQMLFFSTGNADVWQAVQVRVAEMNRAQALAARQEREEQDRIRKERAQLIDNLIIGAVIVGAVIILGVMIYFTVQAAL